MCLDTPQTENVAACRSLLIKKEGHSSENDKKFTPFRL